MESCCNSHDICYDTCLSDKELCDLDFKRCLYKFCDSYEKTQAGEMLVKGKVASHNNSRHSYFSLGFIPYTLIVTSFIKNLHIKS